MASKPSEQQHAPPAAMPASDRNELSLPDQARILLASDMHLGEHDGHTAQWFTRCLQSRSQSFTDLILLGDLFEAWTGDDQIDPVATEAVQALRLLSDRMNVYVMRGNRDFLLDLPLPGQHEQASFTAQTGITMLADPCLLSIGEQQWLLSHGDKYCTDDIAYQKFRLESRQPQWAQGFLSQSLPDRMALARRMREQSTLEKTNKTENLTDVTTDAAQQDMSAHGVTRLIHGHTHRPAHHEWESNGQTFSRHVLPDWDAALEAGGFMQLDRTGVTDLAPGPL